MGAHESGGTGDPVEPAPATSDGADWRGADWRGAEALRRRCTLRTPRLMLRPVGPEHLGDLVALKTDPRVFGAMLNGVRPPGCVREELEDDIDHWRARGH